MPLSRDIVGTYPERSSHATCQGTFGHSRLSSLSHCGLILAKSRISVPKLISTSKKKKKKRQGGMNGRTFSQNTCKRGKSHQITLSLHLPLRAQDQ